MSQVREKADTATADDVLCPPHVRPMTREEFERAGELRIFGPEERLELIGGEVIRKEKPRPPEAASIGLSEEVLRGAFARGYDVRVRLPLALGPHNEPEPHVSVVTGSPRDYLPEHPRSAVLVLEVPGTALRFDRGVKAGLYARAGIADYWLVNLQDRVLEVHREPAPMPDQPFGHHCRSITRHAESESVSPLATPSASIRVADLLP